MTEELINEIFRDIDSSFTRGTSNEIIKTIVYHHLKQFIVQDSPVKHPLIYSEKDNQTM